MAYLKRHAAPAVYKIMRKENKYIACPLPGAHNKENSIPLIVFLRDMLGYVKTNKEAVAMLNNGEILVNGQKNKESKIPIGTMDIISIPKSKEHFKILPDRTGLKFLSIAEKDAGTRILKIINKTTLSNKKTQLRFHDGTTTLSDLSCKVGDSAEFSLKDKKATKMLPLKKGASVLVYLGKSIGKKGKIADIIKIKGTKDKVVLEDVSDSEGNPEKEKIGTSSDYVIVVG